MDFPSLKDLADYINGIFTSSDLYNQSVKIIGDVSSAKYSSKNDLYIELSQQTGASNYSMTVFFPNSYASYVLERLDIKNPNELVGKKWEFMGNITLWKGNLRFVMTGKALFPVGDSNIELKKMKILSLLKEKGFLRIKERTLNELEPIKKIAVVSSPTAAGYQDFEKNIIAARNIPVVHLYPALMQGAETVDSVINAMTNIIKSKIPYDVVALIRGGGSKSDLMYFDDVKLGVYIAKFNEIIPVLTGIGHEQDTSIPDYVSFKRYSTPTEAARDIVRQIDEVDEIFVGKIDDLKESFDFYQKTIEDLISLKNTDLMRITLENCIFYQNKSFDDFHKIIDNSIENIFSLYEKNFSYTILSTFSESISSELKYKNALIESKKSEIGMFFNDQISFFENYLNEQYAEITGQSPFGAFMNNGAVIRKNSYLISRVKDLNLDDEVEMYFPDGKACAKIIRKEDQAN